MSSRKFQNLFMPGFVFQSVVIAGGYGTGRELVEYFMRFGPLGGLMGMLGVTTLIWSFMLALSFEFARISRAYDYRSFFRSLLGRYWIVFEILYVILLCLVLAVIGSAAGVLLRDNFRIPFIFGVAFTMALIGFLAFEGSRVIVRFLSSWSILLYVAFGAFLCVSIAKFGPSILDRFSDAAILPSWSLGGLKYAFYNIAVIPAVLFCIKGIETRKEALSAGLLGGVIGIIPGVLLYIAIMSFYPSVIPEEIPVVFVLRHMRFPLLLIVFQIALFGALVTTGIGFIHAVNERIFTARLDKGKDFPRWQRPVVAIGLLCLGLSLSTLGIINLIAKGYGTISWGFFVVYVIPMITVGLAKILRQKRSHHEIPPK
ncbi:MAG: hypothetical protein PVH84_04285 [Candidatus Aminicenantes bacterium]